MLGASILLGGIRHPVQTFNRQAAATAATLLFLSAVGLLVPAAFDFITRHQAQAAERTLSLEIAIVLLIVLELVTALVWK